MSDKQRCNYDDELHKPRPLQLALLGYNNDLTTRGIHQIAKNNREQVMEFAHDKYSPMVIFKDGTIIQGIYSYADIRG